MRWSENYKTNTHDTDMNGIVSLTGIMRYMQDTANCQMEGEGPSYDELFSNGKAFVLSRFCLSVYRPLHGHDKIESQTWACPSQGASFNRCYSISKDGVIAAEASSVWALVDTETHRLCRVSDFENNYCSDAPRELDMPLRFRIPPEIQLSLVGERTVEYGDVDMNRHMNNTRYGDILCGHLPSMDKKRIIKIEINYRTEAPLGECLKIYMGDAGDGTYYFRTVRADGKINIEAMTVCDEI